MKTARKGFRFEVSMVGSSVPLVSLRAASIDDAEEMAAQDLGVPASRVIAARVCSSVRRAGRFVGAK